MPNNLKSSLVSWQFSLRMLCGLIALCAVVLASVKLIGTVWTAMIAAMLGLVIGIIMIRYGRKNRGLVLATLCGVGSLFTAGVLISEGTAHYMTTAPRSLCSTNLKWLTLAINSYREKNGYYPPAYTADEDGNPLHSWRTLLLPYLEHSHIFDDIRFDEPWDSPHNSKFHNTAVPCFVCPDSPPHYDESGKPNLTTMTSYVAVVGPNTAWPGSEPVRELPADSTTILLVEVADSGIHWMEPRDLHVTQMSTLVNPRYGQGISSHHPGLAVLAFGDTNTRAIRSGEDPRVLQALLSRHEKDKPPIGDWFSR